MRLKSELTVKLKQSPSDFRVIEKANVESLSSGPYSLYTLDKSNWTTLDAIEIIRKRWHLAREAISFGGLKDRHAHTTQHFTILNGPVKSLSDDGLEVKHVGYAYEAFTSDQIQANQFQMTIRDATTEDIAMIQQAIPELSTIGVPNYFDDQRFGGVGASQQFVARDLVLGQFEAAMKRWLTEPLNHERAGEKLERELIANKWKDWELLAKTVRRQSVKSVMAELHRSGDFCKAFMRVRPEEQQMLLAAWQSHLWNKILDRWITTNTPEQLPIALRTSNVHFPKRFLPEKQTIWDELQLPYPSARLSIDPTATWAEAVQHVMAEEQITLKKMLVPNMRRPFFSKGLRPAKVAVHHISMSSGFDEANPGRQAIKLQFDLPRGAYATMVFKRLALG